MILPTEYYYGIDIALKKLRPNARFCISGTEFQQWFDPTGAEPPTWNEVMEQIEKDKAAADEWIAKQQKVEEV